MNLLDEKINTFKSNEELIQSRPFSNNNTQKLDIYDIANISNEAIIADLKKDATFNLGMIIPIIRDFYSQLKGKDYQEKCLIYSKGETLYSPNILFSTSKNIYTREIALINKKFNQDCLTKEESLKLQEQGDLIVIFSQKLTANKLKYPFPKKFEYDIRNLFSTDENYIFNEFMKALINRKLVLNTSELSIEEMQKVKDEFLLKQQSYTLTKKISK